MIKTLLNKKSLKNSISGFTLIETFVAVTILAFVIVGPLSIASNSITSSLYAKDQVVASYLAEEAIEYVRNVRDNNHLQGLSSSANWLTGLSSCMSPSVCVVDVINGTVQANNYCGSSSCPLKYSNGLYGYTSGWVNSIFTRDVEIVTTSPTEVAIYVTVKWKTSSLPTRTIVVKEILHNWQL